MTIRALVKSVALAALCTLPASAQAGVTVQCKVTEVAAFSDRVHVRCSGFTPISYYAVPTSGNSAEAARFTIKSLDSCKLGQAADAALRRGKLSAVTGVASTVGSSSWR